VQTVEVIFWTHELLAENGVSTMLEFGIDNISVEFGRHMYQHCVLYIKHYL
jgi:hypothetical protein